MSLTRIKPQLHACHWCVVCQQPTTASYFLITWTHVCSDHAHSLHATAYPLALLQVYLAKWQETDVAVKVITQKLSPLREIHDQTSMQPCHGRGKHASTQAAGQAEGVGNQHMGICLQGQCHPVGNNQAASNEYKVKNPTSSPKLVSFYQQIIPVWIALLKPAFLFTKGTTRYMLQVITRFGSILLSAGAAQCVVLYTTWSSMLSRS